jgi:hypothetical protein
MIVSNAAPMMRLQSASSDGGAARRAMAFIRE